MRVSDQQFNRLTVLKRLRAAEPVSRTELARLSGLNGATITAIVGDLVERGMVREDRVATSSPGRPRVNLSINPEGAFVAGATLTDGGRISGEIVDLRGQSVFPFSEPARLTARFADVAGQFVEVIARAIATCPIPNERISQVGIGLPAILDNRSGVVEFLETFEPGPFPFGAFVEERLGIPTRIDNTMNLLARTENWFGAGAEVQDFTLVLLDLGVGAARYQDGQLMVGSHGIEAELGHTKIVPEGGRPCHCGARGCLQTYSSVAGIVEQCHEILGVPPVHFSRLRAPFGECLAAAEAGDERIRAVFSRAARYLGIGVANHINMQDPERVVIVSRDNGLVQAISADFYAALDENTLPALRNRMRVTFKTLNQTAYAKGAAAMMLERLYLSR